jgi:hypothetical protein
MHVLGTASARSIDLRRDGVGVRGWLDTGVVVRVLARFIGLSKGSVCVSV